MKRRRNYLVPTRWPVTAKMSGTTEALAAALRAKYRTKERPALAARAKPTLAEEGLQQAAPWVGVTGGK